MTATRATTLDVPALRGSARLPAGWPRPHSGRSVARWLVGAGVLAAVLSAALAAGIGRTDLGRIEGAAQLREFIAAGAHPRLDAGFVMLTVNATLTTLAYAVLGTVLTLVIGVVGGIVTSQTWWRSGARGRSHGKGFAVWVAARAGLAVPRGIHEVIWGLLLLSLLGIQPVVAVLAIGIPFGAVTAKVFSEIIDETSPRPYRAMVAAGASRRTALAYGLLPLALPDLVSYGFYRFECAIRSAAILGLVGAGGLGFQLQLSFQSLQYNEIWTLLYALIALCAAADRCSSAVRVRRNGSSRRGYQLAWLALATVLVPLSSWWIGLDLSVLWDTDTWALAGQILGDAWPPHLPGGATVLLGAAVTTLGTSVLAVAFAFAGGLLLAFPAANLSRWLHRSDADRVRRTGRLLQVVAARGVLIVLRAIPPPVWALLILFLLFPGPIAGALALGVYTLGVLGRLMAEAVENIDERPLRALRVNGTSALQTFWYGMMPAAAPRFTALGLYRWEVAIRETVVVGVVGAGGLGLLLDQQLASFDYAGVTTTLVALMALTLLVDLTSAAIRRALR
ncbi:MAG TPA: ABC transporter permease subunit [Micromonosporaceae bacterium]|nr:ABC transporter permease subunit [Micromonosporaceae bacterium]